MPRNAVLKVSPLRHRVVVVVVVVVGRIQRGLEEQMGMSSIMC